MSSKCYLNIPNFCFIIAQTRIYIEHYLWGGRAEFKAAINRITVDFGSFSLIPPPPPHPHSANLTPTTPNHLVASPSPHLRDVGSTINILECAKWTTAAPTPPPRGHRPGNPVPVPG